MTSYLTNKHTRMHAHIYLIYLLLIQFSEQVQNFNYLHVISITVDKRI